MHYCISEIWLGIALKNACHIYFLIYLLIYHTCILHLLLWFSPSDLSHIFLSSSIFAWPLSNYWPFCLFEELWGNKELWVCLSGAGIAQWLERRTRDWKVVGSNPRSGGRNFFSRVTYLCWLLFRYPFHPHVTAVARKRSRSFCQKWRWQITAKNACTTLTRLCMKWHGAWLYGVHRTCAETAAVSCGTSHASAVSTPLRWILKTLIKKIAL